MRALRTAMGMALTVMLLTGCGHHDNPETTNTSIAKQEALVSPSNPNDAVAWRAFLSKAILVETHDPNLHPYAFVVPAGDSADAMQQRGGETMAIRGMLGHTVLPGNMLAFTGSDSNKVVEVIDEAFRTLPAHSMQGLTILYVGEPAAAMKVQAAVKAAGAELRVRAIQAP
ncbi:hypothetical protein ACPPVV_16240 [Rhodanobacter sp. Col0626]|uniref:hypothetical protein n=1 Tax=Rhodanobacter sp. Col0626 TaxID=3415679 RepID=UPI003CE88324